MTAELDVHARRIVPRQFKVAQQRGWLPGVVRAAEKHGVSAALLLAIGSRETNLDPKYLLIAGDNGNGYGLTQADIRSYKAWVESGKWKVADECFLLTAGILASGMKRYPPMAGDALTVRARNKKIFGYVGAVIPSHEVLERIVVSSYNCGDWAYYHFSNGNSIDRGTTPGPSGKPDYSADVLARREVFAQLLSEIPA